MSDPIKLSIHHKKKRNMGQIICSTLTSVTKVLIVQPFDFLRYRIQTSFKTQYHLTSVIKRMSTMEGLNIFLKASTVTATGIFISSFSVFFFYQKGKDFFLNRFYYKNDRYVMKIGSNLMIVILIIVKKKESYINQNYGK